MAIYTTRISSPKKYHFKPPNTTAFITSVRYNFERSESERMRLMSTVETYLDLDILINGGMDTFLLILVGRAIHFPVQPRRILAGALVGEIPVLLVCCSVSPWTTLSKWLAPFLMVLAAFPRTNLGNYFKALIGFWFVSAGLGGFVYALWGWLQSDNGLGKETFALALNNIWLLPLLALAWWLIQHLWQSWLERKSMLKQILYDLEIDFGDREKGIVRIRALLDTGNHLRDPLTGFPVILLEEEVAATSLPDQIRPFLKIPWKDQADPWPLLWKVNPSLVKCLVFIPFQAIDRQSWLFGIRPERVTYFDDRGSHQIQATVALVDQVLSSEGEYQALLHPEHVRKGGE